MEDRNRCKLHLFEITKQISQTNCNKFNEFNQTMNEKHNMANIFQMYFHIRGQMCWILRWKSLSVYIETVEFQVPYNLLSNSNLLSFTRCVESLLYTRKKRVLSWKLELQFSLFRTAKKTRSMWLCIEIHLVHSQVLCAIAFNLSDVNTRPH